MGVVEPMILELRNITKRWAGHPFLKDCNLALEASDVAVLIGANGTGKTTLLRIVAGIIKPHAGQVLVGGHCLETQSVLAKAQLGYVPDGLDTLPDLLVSEFLTLVVALKQRGEVPSDWQERLGVGALYGQRLRSLSFGQRKRVAIVAALIGQPPLLLLDEPSNGLDPSGVELIVQLVNERREAKRTTLVSTNDKAFQTALSGTVFRLEAGEIRCDSAISELTEEQY